MGQYRINKLKVFIFVASLILFLFPKSVNATSDQIQQNYFRSHLFLEQQQDCAGQSAWVWANGENLILEATQIEDKLAGQGFDSKVTVSYFGEKNACYGFHPHSIDVRVRMNVPTAQLQSDLGQTQFISEITLLTGEILNSDLPINVTTIDFNGSIFPKKQITPSLNGVIYPLPKNNFQRSILNWINNGFSIGPTPRIGHGYAYDSSAGYNVVFGGDDTGLARLDDTWFQADSIWSKSSEIFRPEGRTNINEAMVFSGTYPFQGVFLFGGLGQDRYLNDTWLLTNKNWISLPTEMTPAPRDAHAVSLTDDGYSFIMFGGNTYDGVKDDTWKYQAGWYELNPLIKPSARFYHAMEFDEKNKFTLLFGGENAQFQALGDTWVFRNNEWFQMEPLHSPSARYAHSMAYNPERGTVMLYGGTDGTVNFTDLWEFDGLDWNEINTTDIPTPAITAPIVWDGSKKIITFFGGGSWQGDNLTLNPYRWELDQVQLNKLYLPLVQNHKYPFTSIRKKVLVISYDPILSDGKYLHERYYWNAPINLAEETVRFFKQVSHGYLNYEIIKTINVNDWVQPEFGFAKYNEQSFEQAYQTGWRNGLIDYLFLINRTYSDGSGSICDYVNTGGVDEIWVYSHPDANTFESIMIGPQAYWINGKPVTQGISCNRTVPMMFPNYERDMDCSIENFGHRSESIMNFVYGWPDYTIVENEWEKYTVNNFLVEQLNYSGCGNIHFPPNGTADYDYSNLRYDQTYCDSFYLYPEISSVDTTIKPVNCTVWGCDHYEFFDYWFSHIPYVETCGIDGYTANWWKYLAEPTLALAPAMCKQEKPNIINFFGTIVWF